MGCVIPSASPVSVSGWDVPPQKDILAAAMTPGPPQHAPPLLSVWLWSLWEWAHPLGGNSSQLLPFVVVFFPSLPINSHDHEGMETDHFIPHHPFYCHDRTSHLCRIDTNLSSISCSFLLSCVNKHQRYLNSSTWGSKPPLEWTDPFPDWCWSSSATSPSFTINSNRSWRSPVSIGQCHQQNQGQTPTWDPLLPWLHLQFASIRIFKRIETEQDIFVRVSWAELYFHDAIPVNYG